MTPEEMLRRRPCMEEGVPEALELVADMLIDTAATWKTDGGVTAAVKIAAMILHMRELSSRLYDIHQETMRVLYK